MHPLFNQCPVYLPGLNNVARYQAIAIFIIKPIAQTAKRALARTRIAESKMRGKTAIKRAMPP
ncbi:hypothetical protein [Slackia isoflavoniconvertens]|uniref:hypothetical protein n=1 Tax=Slackia isoflavoniconvertens TaxID=572010 RepID=UPI003AB954E5